LHSLFEQNRLLCGLFIVTLDPFRSVCLRLKHWITLLVPIADLRLKKSLRRIGGDCVGFAVSEVRGVVQIVGNIF
jgi:hypothetical protein